MNVATRRPVGACGGGLVVGRVGGGVWPFESLFLTLTQCHGIPTLTLNPDRHSSHCRHTRTHTTPTIRHNTTTYRACVTCVAHVPDSDMHARARAAHARAHTQTHTPGFRLTIAALLGPIFARALGESRMKSW